MRLYKKKGKVLYYAEGKEANVHYVPTINWSTYLCDRLNVSKICRIFDTIDEAEEAAIS